MRTAGRLPWWIWAALALAAVGATQDRLREGLIASITLAIAFVVRRVYRHFKTPAVADWRSAERAAAAWLRSNGCRRVYLTRAGADGGIDVLTAGLAVQVKHTARRVGRPTVQQVVGAAITVDRAPAVFSTGGFTAPAVDYAAEHDVALFHLHDNGAAEPLNRTARQVGHRSFLRRRQANSR